MKKNKIKKIKKLWLKGVYLLVNIFIIFGFLLPYLFSNKNDLSVLIGVAVLIIDVTHILFYIINNLKLIKK